MMKTKNSIENSPIQINDHDFGTSPLRFEFEILLEEYRKIRDEIVVHLENEQTIINYSIALIAATVALLQFGPSLQNQLNINLETKQLLLILSLLFSALGLMYIEQDILMATLAKYINHVLRPRFGQILSLVNGDIVDVLKWDDYRSTELFVPVKIIPSILMSLARYSLTVLPSFLTIIIYLQLKHSAVVSAWENLLFVFACALFLGVIFIGLYDGLLYLNISLNTAQIIKWLTNIRSLLRTRKFWIPFLTIILGYFPMLVLSVKYKAFWLTAQYEFSFLSIPSVFIGDLILLPIFNYLYFEFIQIQIKAMEIKKHASVYLLINTISLALSIIVNYIQNKIWVSDRYLGFMDFEANKLSIIGVYHMIFSIIELFFIISFVGFWITSFVKKNYSQYLFAQKIWWVILIFTTLTIPDFFVRHVMVLNSGNLLKAFASDYFSLTTLYIAIFVTFIGYLGMNKLGKLINLSCYLKR